MKYIATNIKVLRNEARLSFEELSEITDIAVQRLKDIEKGKVIPTTKEVEILCKPLRIHYEDIIERDILQERNEAGKRMRKSSERNNYNWYLGDRKMFALYLSYLIIVPIALIAISTISKYLNLDIIPIYTEEGVLLTTTWIEAFITAYSIVAEPVGICILIWFLIKIKYRFQWWHIFLASFVFSLIPLIGIVLMLPSLGYSFYKSIIKRGRN